MSIQVVTYEAFQSATQAFINANGDWTGRIDPALPGGSSFISSDAQFCDGACLQLQLFPVKNQEVPWAVTYSVNISVNMAQYGNANALDFTWAYWPMYAASYTLNTTTFPIRAQINDVSFDDAMAGTPIADFAWHHVWPGNLISHSGTTSANRGSDGTTGYILIALSYSTVPDENVTIDQYTKGISFKITTPTQTVAPTISSAGGSTTLPSPSSTSASTSGLVPLPPYIPLPPFSDTLSSSSTSGSIPNPLTSSSSTEPNSQPSPSAKMSTGAIGGIAVGGTIFLTLLFIALFLYRRRKNRNRLASWSESEAVPTAYPHEKRERPRSISTYTHTESSDGVYTIPVVPVSDPVSGNNPIAPHIGSYSSETHDTATTATPTDHQSHPPYYGNEPAGNARYDHVQPVFPALARWANANRALISHDLEARLEAAGFLPTDDPDNLTEEEWITEHNVTKLEVMRIRALYQAREVENPSGRML